MDAPAQQIALAHSAGSGPPVVWLHAGEKIPAAASLLAQYFHMLVFTIANGQGAAATEELANAIGPHASEPVGLIADAASTHAALQLAAARPDLLRAVVLIAPAVPQKLPGEFKTPVMALFGTREAPAHIGRSIREIVSGCHVMFVYDTDQDMANQRPEAVEAILREFLTAGDRFLVTSKSGKIYP
jgi:pimeloyl-ACP methyl ester carboxylesterase